jgi:hypothetical protein
MAVFKIGYDNPLHATILAGIRRRWELSYNKRADRYRQWSAMEEQMLAYLPEKETDGKRRRLREQEGEPQYTTIEIPYGYAQLLSAHTYWTSVFLSRNPVLQFSARHGEPENSVMAIEALLDYQLQVGMALGPYYVWLLDAGKYGEGIVGKRR